MPSIQDIIPPARSRPIRPSITPTGTQPPQPPTPTPPILPERPYEPSRGRSLFFVWVLLGAVAIVAVVVTLMSTLFHSATITVSVQSFVADAAGEYSLALAPEAPLSYTPLVIEETATKSVPASGSVSAEDRASGTITVTNTLAKSQRLITNTRFESGGMIYRIHSPLVVPAKGSVDALVYADQPGDTYNVTTATFTVPGLKGSPQFDAITGKTKTPISGGFIGMRATVDKQLRSDTITALRADLERTLRERAANEAATGTIVFADTIDIQFREMPDKADGSNASISVTALLRVPQVDSAELARTLADHAAVSFADPLVLTNPAELSASLTGGAVGDALPLTVTLSGTAHLRGAFDAEAFKVALAGRGKGELDSVRPDFPALTGQIGVKIYPFWSSVLPKNPNRLTITEALDR